MLPITYFILHAHRVTGFISFLNYLSNKKIPWKTGIYILSEREFAILVSESFEEPRFYKKIISSCSYSYFGSKLCIFVSNSKN